LTFKGLKVLK